MVPSLPENLNRQVRQLLRKGKSCREIALQMNVSVRAVANIRKNTADLPSN